MLNFVESCIVRTFFVEQIILDNLERLEHGAFLPQHSRIWRHRAWREAANVGMMTAIGHVEDGLASLFVEYGRDYGQIWQM